MCARYCYFASEDFKDRFATENHGPDFKSFNIAPGTINPTITRESPKQVVMMTWLVGRWPDG